MDETLTEQARVHAAVAIGAFLAAAVLAVAALGLLHPLWPASAVAGFTTAAVVGMRRHQARRVRLGGLWDRATVDEEIAGRLSAAAGRIIEVRRIPGTANAFLLTRDRVLVTDGLRALDPAVVDAVLAHEAAHLASGDLARLRWTEAPVEALAKALRPGAGPVLWGAFLLTTGAVIPLAAAAAAALTWRRYREIRADVAAVGATGNPAAVIDAIWACHGRFGPLGTHPHPHTRARIAAGAART